ncbi:MAG TPA: 30S ribosomal protein S6 [Syntrophus sp. (in: bacteria)]|nr:30S ribosomal protein S6 [Syntrophus sp. (in: bacteria)]
MSGSRTRTLDPRGGSALRRYDIIFIVPVDLPEDEISAMCERYSTFITDHQGIVVKIDRWGKRKLAYEIKKQRRGYYLLFDVVSDHAAITEIERNFKIDERILKYLTVRRDGTFTREAIEKEIADAAKKAEGGDAGKPSAEPVAPKMVIPAAAVQEAAAKTVEEGVK